MDGSGSHYTSGDRTRRTFDMKLWCIKDIVNMVSGQIFSALMLCLPLLLGIVLLLGFVVCTVEVIGEAAKLRAAALPRHALRLCDLDSGVSRRCASGQKQRHWLLGTSASLH